MTNSVAQSLDSVKADVGYILMAEMAAVNLPESLHGNFIQYAKCLYVKRGDAEYVRLLKDATFSRTRVSFFPKKMKEAGVGQVQIDLFMSWVQDMFDELPVK